MPNICSLVANCRLFRHPRRGVKHNNFPSRLTTSCRSCAAGLALAGIAIVSACSNSTAHQAEDSAAAPPTSVATESTTSTTWPTSTTSAYDPSAEQGPDQAPPSSLAFDPQAATPSTISPAWDKPGEPSPLQLGTGSKEAEYPAGESGRQAQLVGDKLDVLIRQVDAEHSAVLVDVVQLFVGDQAVPAATADGVLRPDEQLPGNYYIRNTSPKLREAQFAEGVTYTDTQDSIKTGVEDVSAALIQHMSAKPNICVTIHLTNGLIDAITEPDVVDTTLEQ